MSKQTIYINKRQLGILAISLMSLTRDDKAFEYALDQGVFKEDDIYEYIDTIQNLAKALSEESGVLIVSELGKEITDDCIDLWGNPINEHD